MLPENWHPIDGIELEPSALEAVKANKNMYVLAGPGAGKTELLAQKAAYLLETNTCKNPQKILAISFKRDAAKNISERVKKRCGTELAKRFISLTYDAFAKNLLDHFRIALPSDYRPAKQYDVILDSREVIDVFEIVDPDIVIANTSYVIINALTRENLPFKNEGLSELSEAVATVWQILLKGKRNIPARLTFPMITRLSELLVRVNPLIRRILLITYSHVFLDEFQDTTTTQYGLIKTCFQNSESSIIAVGDTKQRIMVWAGADKSAFNKFQIDFNADKQCLLMNHRSAPRLVQIQRVLAKRLSNDEVEVKQSLKWDSNDGICEIWNFDDHEKEAAVLAEQIETYINDEDLAPREICIIVKQRPDRYGQSLIEDLENRGIHARNESQLQDLLTEECVKIILDFVVIIFSEKAGKEWLNIINLLKSLRFILIEKDLDPQRMNLLENQLSNSLTIFKEKFLEISEEDELEKICWEVIKYFGKYELIGLFPQYKKGSYLIKIVKRLSQNLYIQFVLYNDWLTAIDNLKGRNSIPIMTIHKSKGLEYDTVIFIGLEDSAFWSFKNQSEEDTCAFFVALSRAKRRVIFTFSDIRNTGRNDSLSRQNRSIICSLYDMLAESGVVDKKKF